MYLHIEEDVEQIFSRASRFSSTFERIFFLANNVYTIPTFYL